MIGIFGAAGFIGQHLTRRLVAQGRDVVAVVRKAPDVLPEGWRVFEGDFNDPGAMVHALRGVDTVVQLVSNSTPALQAVRTARDFTENVASHATFLEKCLESGVSRYVFVSSGGTVYGPTVGSAPISESAPTDPICDYGISKLMVEKLIGMHGLVDDLDFAILRVSNPFGPGQVFKNGQGLIPALISRFERGLPIQIFGDGSASRDYLYISDLVDAIESVIDLPGHRQVTLNVGSGVARSILEVVRTVEEVAQIKFEIEYLPERRTDVHTISLDIERAMALLGWRPQTSFRQGLAQTLGERSSALPCRHGVLTSGPA